MNNIKRQNGVFFTFLAAILWSFGGICAKFIQLNPLTISVFRGVLAAFTIGCCTGKWIFRPNRLTLLSAFCIFGTSSLFMVANKMTTAANAIALQYTSPVFIIIMTWLFIKEKPRIIDIVAVILILNGVLLFFIERLNYGALLGNIISIISGIFFAGVFFVNSLPGTNAKEAAYLGCLFHIIWLPMVFFDKNIAAIKLSTIGVIAFAGIFQLGFAYMAFSKGIKATPPVAASVICAIEPVLNPVWVFLIMAEQPGWLSICGAAIVIITATCYSIFVSKKRFKNPENLEGQDNGKVLSC